MTNQLLRDPRPEIIEFPGSMGGFSDEYETLPADPVQQLPQIVSERVGRGGDFARSYSNKLMRLRVLMQFIAVVILVLVFWWRTRGG